MSEKENISISVLIGFSVSVVAVIVSAIQVYTATQNNKLIEAQTIESFIPHLMKKETKDIALIAMNKYVDRTIVNDMAALLGSETALTVLSKKGSESQKNSSSNTLNELNTRRTVLITKMFDPDKGTRIGATTQLIRNWDHTAQLLEDALLFAKTKSKNKSGTINTLVLLSYFSAELLNSYQEELNDYFNIVKDNGSQTRSNIEKVRENMAQPNKANSADAKSRAAD